MTVIVIFIKKLGKKLSAMESTLLFTIYSPSLNVILATD